MWTNIRMKMLKFLLNTVYRDFRIAYRIKCTPKEAILIESGPALIAKCVIIGKPKRTKTLVRVKL